MVRLASKFLGIDRMRVFQFAFSYSCLASFWCLEDGHDPSPTMKSVKTPETHLVARLRRVVAEFIFDLAFKEG